MCVGFPTAGTSSSYQSPPDDEFETDMRNLLLTLLHLAVVAAKLCGPGGIRAVIAENLLLKHQLIVLRRARRRAPNLTRSDRLLCGFESLFLNPGRIRKLAIALRCGAQIMTPTIQHAHAARDSSRYS
jgi:hypothetical protein